MDMKVLTVVGARPQFVKAAVVSRALRQELGMKEILVHTGQHFDVHMSQVFFDEMGIPRPDYHLGVGGGTHGQNTGRMIEKIEETLLAERPDWVLVFGDTDSTLAGAVAAVKLHLSVAHVEAGLRSFNRRMPEEINRLLADRLSDLLFCPTRTAVDNLRREGIGAGVHFTGDVMLDALIRFRPMAARKSKILERVESGSREYLLLTIHRAENTDDPGNLKRIIAALGELGEPVVFPIHPRTKKVLRRHRIPLGGKFRAIDPVGYLDMLFLEMNAARILTDSGGVQKEAYMLGVPCVTLRNETEWVETAHDGWNIVAGTEEKGILRALGRPFPSRPRRAVFGDGHAAEKIAEIIDGL